MAWKMSHLLRRGQPRNDFDITVSDSKWGSEWEDVFAAQTVRLEMNLVQNEVTVIVRQLRAGVIQDIIFNLLTRETPFDKFHIKPVQSKKHGAEYAFCKGRLVDHSCILDYLSTDPITHRLVLQFEHVNLKSPTGEMKLTHYSAFPPPDVDFDVAEPFIGEDSGD